MLRLQEKGSLTPKSLTRLNCGSVGRSSSLSLAARAGRGGLSLVGRVGQGGLSRDHLGPPGASLGHTSRAVSPQMPWGPEATPTWPGHRQQQKTASACRFWGHLCVVGAGLPASSSLAFPHFQSWGGCSARTQARMPSHSYTRTPDHVLNRGAPGPAVTAPSHEAGGPGCSPWGPPRR